MKIKDQLQFILRGAAVTRFHVDPVIKPQTDGAHSFGVAWICYLLSNDKPSLNLILAALAHDLAEHKVGDVPFPTKHAIPGLNDQLNLLETSYLTAAGLGFPLTDDEKRILSLADRLEGMCYCVQERALGNKNAAEWYARYRASLPHIRSGAEAEVLEKIEVMMEEASR
jgi:5'-deoxynucleotidase YfbR-like HD superfamily hydrolase